LTILLETVRRFFAAVPGSVANHLNTEELIRIALTALTAGGGVLGLFEAVLGSVAVVFPAPADAALAAALLTVILEVCRRLRHGEALVARRVATRSSR
jgi:hypothetical protein